MKKANVILDIETIPADPDQLTAAMPEEMRNPVPPSSWGDSMEEMQVELAKCPAYGGDEGKRSVWLAKKQTELKEKAAQRRDAWGLKQLEAKQAFFDGAALDARTGRVALIGLRVADAKTPVTVFALADDPDTREKLEDYAGKGVDVRSYANERQMLAEAFNAVCLLRGEGRRVVTFYGHNFDLPFVMRRGYVTGALPPSDWRDGSGRYFNRGFVDLWELWAMGDRQAKTGGLDGLAAALGVPKRKTGDGATFWRMWQADPCAGVFYLVNDLEMTQGIAERMGVAETTMQTERGAE